jgi:hypothetical protein
MPQAIALTSDIFFAAKIRETPKQLGLDLPIATTTSALLAAIDPPADHPPLILIDLNLGEGAISLIERLATRGLATWIFAFLSHVDTEKAARARAAGCLNVMPRSQFTRDLPVILARAR